MKSSKFEKACKLANEVMRRFCDEDAATTAELRNLWETMSIELHGGRLNATEFIKKYSDPALDLRTVTEG